jgi:hypothetical protein
MVIAGNLLIIGMGGPSNIIAWTDLTAPDTDGAWPSVAITGIPMSLSYRGGVVYLMCYSSGSVLTYTSPDLGQTWTPVTNDLPTTASASERFVWSVALGGKWAYSAYSGIVYVSTDFAAWSALGDLGLTGGAAHLEDYNSELYIGNDTGGLVKWGGAAFVLAEAMGQSVQFGAKP